MKKIYEFVITKEEEKIEIEETKNETGDTVKTEKKVKVNVPYKFFIRKPNRQLKDEADLFYSVVLSDCIKQGLLTSNQLYKRFLNDGGILSEPEKKNLKETMEKVGKLQMEFEKLSIKVDKNKEDEEKLINIISEINEIRTDLQRFEFQQSALFDSTAESKARNKTIFWYVLHLIYKEKDNKFIPVFGEGSFEEKVKIYDELEESEEDFNLKLIKKAFLLISFWYTGRINSDDDFKRVDEYSDKTENELEGE